MKRHPRLRAAAIALALVTAACGSDSEDAVEEEPTTTAGPSGPEDTSASEEEPPDRVTIRLPASTQGGGYPTPFAAIRGPGRLITTMIFDTLLFPDVTGEPKPWLAESFESSDDGLTWTFTLQDDVVFHDGEPLTADDVVFSFDYALTGSGAGTGLVNRLDYITSVTATDDRTVVVELDSVRPSFLTDVGGPFGIPILPEHIWADVTDPAQFQSDEALIGSGPYTLDSFDVSTNSFDFVANDDFYLGSPTVERLQIIPTGDPLLALQQGDIDAASAGRDPIPESELDAIGEEFELLTARGEFNVALFFNQEVGFPYEEVDFRQAVAYALDRQDLLERLVLGRGVPGSAGQLGPDNPFLNEDLPEYANDPDLANELLDGIDLVDGDGDGARDLPDGSPFTIELVTSSTDADEAQLVTEYLGAVGLDVEIVAVDQPTSDARSAANDYEMAIVHFGGLSADPSGLIQRFSSTSQSESFTRVRSYSNPEFDAVAMEQATVLDPEERGALVDEMQAILAEDLPALGLYVPDQLYFVDDSTYQGWAYTPGCPPCGVALNKRMLVTGNTDPVSD